MDYDREDLFECPICHSIMNPEDKQKHIEREIKELKEVLNILNDL